jgi:O-acetyl-ADP-ribose deacetylase (regulator of RNase III)
VEVVVGDIANVAEHQAEAYVNAANNELWMGSGVAGALKRAAGPEVEQQAMAQAPIAVGDVALTGSGTMPAPAKAILHAAAMGFTDRTQIYASMESVEAATRKALQLCDANHFHSVVLPALGTGVGGLDDEACATAMVTAIADHIGAGTHIERIRFVVTTADRAAIFQQEIDRIVGKA